MDFKGSSTVFKDGQIRLPKELRAELDLQGGDRLIFHKTKNCGVVVEKSEVDG